MKLWGTYERIFDRALCFNRFLFLRWHRDFTLPGILSYVLVIEDSPLGLPWYWRLYGF